MLLFDGRSNDNAGGYIHSAANADLKSLTTGLPFSQRTASGNALSYPGMPNQKCVAASIILYLLSISAC